MLCPLSFWVLFCLKSSFVTLLTFLVHLIVILLYVFVTLFRFISYGYLNYTRLYHALYCVQKKRNDTHVIVCLEGLVFVGSIAVDFFEVLS